MKKTNILGLLCLLLMTIACSPSSTPVPPSNQVNSQETDALPERPEKVCGDRLPEDFADSASNPVSFYPVYVNYSADNLAKVKKH
jgi:hypothetical protein